MEKTDEVVNVTIRADSARLGGGVAVNLSCGMSRSGTTSLGETVASLDGHNLVNNASTDASVSVSAFAGISAEGGCRLLRWSFIPRESRTPSMVFANKLSKIHNTQSILLKTVSKNVESKIAWLDGGDSSRGGLLLRYDVPWPLHLVIGEEAFVSYNKLFSRLLSVQRANHEVQEIWKYFMQVRGMMN